jgi:hypothetical protein
MGLGAGGGQGGRKEVFVSAGPQAVRAARVNIWGVRRMCGTLLMFSVLFTSSALAPFSVLREFIFLKKVPPFVFRLARGHFCMLCDKRNSVCALVTPGL